MVRCTPRLTNAVAAGVLDAGDDGVDLLGGGAGAHDDDHGRADASAAIRSRARAGVRASDPSRREQDGRVTTPFERLGAKKRAEGLPADRLPPGQYVARGWPVPHYGPVPDVSRELGPAGLGRPRTGRAPAGPGGPRRAASYRVVADLHCVTKYSVLDLAWAGVPAAALLDLVPPAPDVTHVMVWAEYGYSANLTLADLTRRRRCSRRTATARR